MRLQDKICIVTGSSGGIGQATAERFAEEGAIVVVNSRHQAKADAVAENLKKKGYRSDAVACDVAKKDDVFALVDKVAEKYGRIDVMVNNAGVNFIHDSIDLDEADFKRVLDTNLSGVLFGCQAAARHMMKQSNGGNIINVASAFSHAWTFKRAAYSSAKTGLLGLNGVLAVEWAKNNIRVNCCAPGWIQTDMNASDQDSVGGYTDKDIYRRTPMGRYGTVREVANMMLFLASDEASFVTGVCFDVDGGWRAFGGWC